MTRNQISKAAYDLLAGWKIDRPVATLMGEFSAGKSTLLNFILGLDAAPTKVTATHMPPTWFTHSKKPFTTGITWDGKEETVDLGCTKTNFREDFLLIRHGLDSDALLHCDLIDAPGISDPDLQKDALRFLSRYTDFVVWCTAANQAWRQTENAAFNKLSSRIKSQSILVITRMDKLRNVKDHSKVLKRVTAEAGPHFNHVFPLQTLKAAAVKLADRRDHADGAWVKTGGFDFMAAFLGTCASVKPKAASTKKVTKSKSAAAPKNKAKKPAKPAPTAMSEDVAATLTGILQGYKTMPENSQHCLQIDHLIAAISSDLKDVRKPNATLLQCVRIEPDDFDIQRLVSQIGREIPAFANNDRVRLDV